MEGFKEMTNENLPHALHENLERLMNVDRLRISIYNFYAIVTGGLLAALMTQEWDYKYGTWVFLFLFIISIITLLVNWRIRSHVIEFTGMLQKITQDMNIGDYYTNGANQQARLTLRNMYVIIPLLGVVSFFTLFVIQLTMLATNS